MKNSEYSYWTHKLQPANYSYNNIEYNYWAIAKYVNYSLSVTIVRLLNTVTGQEQIIVNAINSLKEKENTQTSVTLVLGESQVVLQSSQLQRMSWVMTVALPLFWI